MRGADTDTCFQGLLSQMEQVQCLSAIVIVVLAALLRQFASEDVHLGSADEFGHEQVVGHVKDLSGGAHLLDEAVLALREVYEARIADIKASAAEHIASLQRDKRILAIAAGVVTVLLLGLLLTDIFIGSVGWVRY